MQEKFVTRKEGVALANERGIPLTVGRVHKDSADGCGPKPAGRYGPTFLYSAEEFLRYAETRVRQHAPDEAIAQ